MNNICLNQTSAHKIRRHKIFPEVVSRSSRRQIENEGLPFQRTNQIQEVYLTFIYLYFYNTKQP